jgi:hypothetical protein
MDEKLKNQAEEILQTAKEYGAEQNFFFTTTFEKYITQLEILDKLKKDLPTDEDGDIALMYTRVVDSSNKTLGSLIKLITTMRNEKDKQIKNPLLDILSGEKKNE